MRKGLTILLLLLGVLGVQAHENVAAGWASLSVKKNFDKGLSLTLRGEYRCRDNFTSNDLYFIRLTGGYKICPYVSVALAYDYFTAQQSASTKGDLQVNAWPKHQHRLLADVAGNYKYKGLTVSLRERYLMAYAVGAKVPAVDADGLYAEYDAPAGFSHILRSLPTISYHIGESKWTPFVSAEFFNSLNKGDGFKLQQYHLFAGTGFKVDAVNSFRFFYVFQTKMPSHKHLHTLGIDYIITLP